MPLHFHPYCLVSFVCSTWFVLGIWKYIIINFIAIFQKSIYIFSSNCMSMSLKGILFDRNLHPAPPTHPSNHYIQTYVFQ